MLQDTIIVGATSYSIIERDMLWRANEGCDGQVRFTELEIDLVTEDRPGSEVANTLIHELMHVVWREYHMPSRPREERCVTTLGFGMTAIYAQNPWVLPYIEDLLHG
jgi:hypothetical protein